MYSPVSFQLQDDALIAQIIAENSFGALISSDESGLQCSHLPFEFNAQRQILRCHMARANSQWRAFDTQTEVLAIFQGPHGYVSPRWYETKLAVPTWNYLAVHVYGVAKIIEDDAEVEKLLADLVAQYENALENPWRLEAPADWQKNLRRAIVGFEISISRIEAKAKMSQNRPAADVAGVISGFESTGQDELAAWMRRFHSE